MVPNILQPTVLYMTKVWQVKWQNISKLQKPRGGDVPPVLSNIQEKSKNNSSAIHQGSHSSGTTIFPTLYCHLKVSLVFSLFFASLGQQ